MKAMIIAAVAIFVIVFMMLIAFALNPPSLGYECKVGTQSPLCGKDGCKGDNTVVHGEVYEP